MVSNADDPKVPTVATGLPKASLPDDATDWRLRRWHVSFRSQHDKARTLSGSP